MAERASIFQTVQIGLESTPGTSVPANKKLSALGIEPSPQSEINTFRPTGQKYAALTALNKLWIEADLTGQQTYSEIVYPLSSVLTTTTPVATGNLTAPTQTAPATATSGGTLAAATYFYKVTALNGNGETIPSNEMSQATTGSTSTVTVNWNAVVGATGYKIYRSVTTNTELLLTTVGAVVTFVDTGALTPSGAMPTVNTTGGFTWTFTPSSTAADTPATFTVEQGDATTRAHKFTNGIVTALNMSFSRDGTELGGSMMGRALTDDIVLTASPSSVELVPVLPTEVSVYLDSTSAGLGTTKLTRAVSAEWRLSDRFGPLWVLDAAQTSFVTHLESEPTLETEVLVEADAQGMGVYADMTAGSLKWLRIEAVGPTILGATTYKLRIDMPVRVSSMGGFSDEDGLYGANFVYTGMHDQTWGKALQVTVVNRQASL